MQYIDLNEALELLNMGGWRIHGGRYGKKEGCKDEIVTGAEVVGDVLMLRHDRKSIASANSIKLSCKVEGGRDPHRLTLEGPAPTKEQRKKSDGGGWHHVQRIRPLIILIQDEIQEEARRAELERREREEQAARIDMERTAQKLKVERETEIRSFFRRQRTLLTRAPLVDIRFVNGSLVLEFEGGHRLSVSAEGEDYGGHCPKYLSIHGGDDHIDLLVE